MSPLRFMALRSVGQSRSHKTNQAISRAWRQIVSPRLQLGQHPYSSIKLLRLRHNNGKEDIQGNLQTISLDSPSCPSFTTLSYVWGQQTCEKFILLDGNKQPVTTNLYAMLKALSTSDEFSSCDWFWVDSICINQADSEERASQVQLMSRIFAESTKTVAWLGGDATDVAAQAISFIKELARLREEDRVSFETYGVRGTPFSLRNSTKWKAIEAFLRMPWWNRIWTVQEGVIAKRVDYYFAGKKIDSNDLALALSTIWICEPHESLMSETAWTAAWNRQRLREWFHKPGNSDDLGLVALMAYTGANQVTDPRDRIYGLLGITSALSRDMVGKPVYEDDVKTIYTRLVEVFLRQHKSLDIICMSQLFRPCAADHSVTNDWPTWLPDWRTIIQPFVTPLMVSQTSSPIGNFRPTWAAASDNSYRYNADGLGGSGIASNVKIDGSQLVCEGALLGVIDGLGVILNQNSASQSHQVVLATSACNKDTVEFSRYPGQLLNDLVSSLVLNRGDRYLSKPAPVKSYIVDFLSLVRLPLEIVERFPWRCQLARKWYESNKNFLWRGKSLRQLCEERVNVDGYGPQYTFTSWQEQGFASRLIDTTGSLTMRRKLLVLQDGSIGMAPCEAGKGDLVFVLMGCSVPVVLRRRSKGSYTFIGEAYIQGYMEGQAIRRCKHKEVILLV